MRPWFSRLGFGFLFAILVQPACASAWKTGAIYDASAQHEERLEAVASSIRPGTVVIVSENHDFVPHHDNQVKFLEALAQAGLEKISVGMEFLTRNFQNAVDQFLAGLLPESEFLKAVEWGGNPFDLYRRQVLFPVSHGGTTLALNAPRELTGRISKVGLSGLTPEEMAELPPQVTLGSAEYFERFKLTMQDHVPAQAIQRYFEAQSVWDETMAWVTTEYLRQHPEQVVVIIVGDFHASYGGGLPDRLRARGAARVVTISQVNLQGLNAHEEGEFMLPHSRWGARADHIWVER